MDEGNDNQLFAKHLVGYSYQLKLLLLFLYRGWKNNYIFELKTEVEEAEKFDDIVFYFKKPGDKEYDMICLQAKHARNEKELKYNNFISTDYKEICNLQKYFVSFQKIKQKGAIMLPSTLIMCNNYNMPQSQILKKSPSDLDVKALIFEDDLSRKNIAGSIFHKWGCYQLKQINMECKALLENGSNLCLLAKEIFESIQSSDKKGETMVKLNLNNYYIFLYHKALMKTGIFETTEVAKFKYDFITGEYRKPPSNKAFRDKFITEFKKYGKWDALKTVKLHNDFFKVLQQKNSKISSVSDEDGEIVDALMKQIFCPSNIADDNILMKNSDKIKEIINRGKQTRFSEKFFNVVDNDIFQRLKNILIEKYKIYLFQKLKNMKLSITDQESLYGDMELSKQLIYCFMYSKISKNTITTCNNTYKLFENTGNHKVQLTNVISKDEKAKKIFEAVLTDIATEKLKSFEFNFESNVTEKELQQITKQIISAVADDHNVLVNSDHEINKTLENLSKIIFQPTKELNRIKFKLSFLTDKKEVEEIEEYDKNIKNALSTFRQSLKAELKKINKKIGDLQNFIIEINNYPYTCENMSEFNDDIEKEIENFKSRLLVVTTPNEKELYEIVGKELGDEFNILNDKAIGKEMFHHILDWAKLNNGKALSNKEIDIFFEKIKEIISSQLVSGLHQEYRGMLREKDMNFQRISEEWEEFFYPYNFESQFLKQFLILRSNIPLLTAIKVEHILREIHHYNNISSLIFHKLSSLCALENFEISYEEQNTITSAFAVNDKNDLIIIVDDSIAETVKEHLSFLNKLTSIIYKNSTKKIVLIVSTNSILMEGMVKKKKFNNDNTYEIVDDNNSFIDLNKESQSKILQKPVTFQGNITSIQEIVDDYHFYQHAMDFTTLSKLLESDSENVFDIGKVSKTFKGYSKQCYLERHVVLDNIDKEIFDTCFKMENHISSFYGMYKDEFRSLLDSFDVNVNLEEYRADFAEKHFTPQSCFIINITGSGGAGYSVVNDYGVEKSYEANNLFFVKNENALNICVEEEFITNYTRENRIVLITDSAGMGKSTFLSSIEHKIRKLDEKKWILRINLNEYTEMFRQIDVNATYIDENFQFHYPAVFECYETILLNSLTNTLPKNESEKTFENYLFEYLFEHGRIVIMFDGYDEIGTNFRKLLISWILRLKNNTKNQIWICSRTCFREELEKELMASSFSLRILSEYHQRKLLQNIWENQWKGKMTTLEKSHMEIYIRALIKEFSKELNDNEKYVGCPLHIIMLADVFMKNKDAELEGEGCFDFMKNAASCQDRCLHINTNHFIPSKLHNLYSLYEKFVMQKIKKHFFEDKGIFGSTRDMVEGYKNKEFLKFKKMHEMLGIKYLIEDADFNKIFESAEKEKFKKYLRQFGTHDAGIIDTTAANSQPIFIHSNYAEYFAACCLIDIFESKKDLVFQLIFKILQSDVIVFSYCAKTLLADKYKESGINIFTKDIKTASTLSGAQQYFLIKWLMDDEKIENKFPKIDNSGKTYLHSAVASEFLEAVVYVILHTYAQLFTQKMEYAGNIFKRYIRSQETLFLLSEYINLMDNEGMTAIMYSVHPNIIDLMHEIVKLGQNSLKPENYANNIKEIINEKPVKLPVELLKLLANKTDDIFYNNCYHLAWKLSYPSLKTLFTHSSADILINVLKYTETNFNFFDVICGREDFDNKKKMELFKCWWNNESLGPEYKHRAGSCILIAAIENDDMEEFNSFFNYLLTENFSLSVVEYFTAACTANTLQFIKLFCDNNAAEIFNCFPLHIAIKQNSNLEIIDYIFTHIHPDINAIKTDEKYDTPLTKLMKSDCYKYYKIKYFLNNGANVNIADTEKNSAWNYAVKSYDDNIIKLFLFSENLEILESELCLETMKDYYHNQEFCVDRKSDNTFRLIEAIKNEDLTLTTFLIWKNANVNVEDEYSKSPLHYACEILQNNFVEILIDNGAMYDKVDVFEKKPIDYCGKNEKNITILKNIEWMFKNVNEPEFDFKLKEKQRDRITDVNYVRSHFLSPHVRNKEGNTILHLMASNKNYSSYESIKMKYFSKFYEISLNTQNSDGNTVLHFAAQQNNINLVKELLENGAYYNAINNFGETPEDLAPQIGQVKNLLHSMNNLFNKADNANIMENVAALIEVMEMFENDTRYLLSFRNSAGEALLHRTILNPDENYTKSLLNATWKRVPIYEEILINLIQQNKIQLVKRMLVTGISFNVALFSNLKNKISNNCSEQFAKINELFHCAHEAKLGRIIQILNCIEYDFDVLNMFFVYSDYNPPKHISSVEALLSIESSRIFDIIIPTSNYKIIKELLRAGSRVQHNYDEIKNKKIKKILSSHISKN